MNEANTLALAGVVQAATLVNQIAQGQATDEDAMRTSIASVFVFDADDVAQIYAGTSGLRCGLRGLIAQLDAHNPERDQQVAHITLTLLRLQATLGVRQDLLDALHDGIVDTQRQVEHFGPLHATVMARLADLYANTISNLRPRVMVAGDSQILQRDAQVERVRALLLAGIRSAVLWHQMGGRRWRLLLQRQRQAMLARGLLSRIALDRG